MRLYLVRHGEAKPKEEDSDRHLSVRGRDQVRRVAAFLKTLDLRVHAIWHSGKPRAEDTAELLAEVVTADQGVILRKGLSPEDDVSRIVHKMAAVEGDLMIVGHMPFMGKLASLLLVDNEDDTTVAFSCGSVACLEFDGSVWAVTWLVTPELVK
jgi:phosphohistidine phosphatase